MSIWTWLDYLFLLKVFAFVVAMCACECVTRSEFYSRIVLTGSGQR